MEHSHGLPRSAPIRTIAGVRDSGAARIRRHIRPAHQPYARPAQAEPARSRAGPSQAVAPAQTKARPAAAGLVQTLIQTATSLVTSLWSLLPFDRRATEPAKQTRAQDPDQGASPAKADWLVQTAPSGKRARLDYTLRSARSAESQSGSDALGAQRPILPPLKEYYAPSQADGSVLLVSPIRSQLPMTYASPVPSVLRECPIHVGSASDHERRTRKRHYDGDGDGDDRTLNITQNHTVDEPVVVEPKQYEKPSADDNTVAQNEEILTSDAELLPQIVSAVSSQALTKYGCSLEGIPTEDDQTMYTNDPKNQRIPILFLFGSGDTTSQARHPTAHSTKPANKPILFSFEPRLENCSESAETRAPNTYRSGAESSHPNESLPRKARAKPNHDHSPEPSSKQPNPTAPMLFSFTSKGHEQQTQTATSSCTNPLLRSFSSPAHEAVRSLVPIDAPRIFLFARDVVSS